MTVDQKIELEYLSSRELARALNVSCRTLHRWARLRKGPPNIKVGRTVYYRRASVEKWLTALERDLASSATVAGQHRCR